MNYISKVTDEIYVGPRLEKIDPQVFSKLKIKSILNLTGHNIEGEIWCQVSDGNTRQDQLHQAVYILRDLIKLNLSPVYVHCVVGRNRSPLVIATYLTLYGGFKNLTQALLFVKDKHPKTSPFSNNIHTADVYLRTGMDK